MEPGRLHPGPCWRRCVIRLRRFHPPAPERQTSRPARLPRSRRGTGRWCAPARVLQRQRRQPRWIAADQRGARTEHQPRAFGLGGLDQHRVETVPRHADAGRKRHRRLGAPGAQLQRLVQRVAAGPRAVTTGRCDRARRAPVRSGSSRTPSAAGTRPGRRAAPPPRLGPGRARRCCLPGRLRRRRRPRCAVCVTPDAPPPAATGTASVRSGDKT